MSFCRKQDALPVPDSLRVLDRFERAVKNLSSAPSYLMATVVGAATGETKRVCLEGPQLFRAVQTENKLGRGRADWDRALRLILDNAARTYRFTDPDAWKLVQERIPPDALATVREAFRSSSTEELAELFSYARTQGLVPIDGDRPVKEIYAYCGAAARVLTERGLYVGRGDFGNSLYVITPRMLAEDDERDRRNAEETRRRAAEGQAYAARLPGYRALTRRFQVNSAELIEGWSGFGFSVFLSATSPQRVDYIYWTNPVNEKTRKARYDWNDLLPITHLVERLSQRHPWLKAWKASGPDRTLSVSVNGRTLRAEFDDDFEKDVVPTWKDAGMRDAPYCRLELRWQESGEGANATLYLPAPDAAEKRSLLVRSDHPPGVKVTGPGRHWLDRLSFHSYAFSKVRQAVVVTPAGEWRLLTLPTRRR